jgi:non-lysosomal glucosylceramidase
MVKSSKHRSCCANSDRRDFIKGAVAGATALASASSVELLWGAGSRTSAGSPASPDHYVPADKNLDPGWLHGLLKRGTGRPYRGAELETIGMPCGGICSGQVYVRGDGTLAHWWVSNNTYNTGYGGRSATTTTVGRYEQGYNTFRPFSPIEQGFALCVRRPDGEPVTRRLDRKGYDAIGFTGEYPVATIAYGHTDESLVPVEVRAEVFSPFIPLNAKDSGLPVTVLRFHLTNRSDTAVDATLAGWLENQVFMNQRGRMSAMLRNRVIRDARFTSVYMDATDAATDTRPERRTRLFEDFEDAGFDNWKVEGSAFGGGPASSGLPGQAPHPHPLEGQMDIRLRGWQGKFFANSFHGGIASKGRLSSRAFTISEPYISYRVCGGWNRTQAGIRLIVDGETARDDVGSFFSINLERRFWDVTDLVGKSAHIEIFDDSDTANLGQINVDDIAFTNLPPFGTEEFSRDHWQFGDVALTSLDPDAAAIARGGGIDEILGLLDRGEFPECDQAVGVLGESLLGVVASTLLLEPGETRQASFLISWYFPNRGLGNRSWAPSGAPIDYGERVGNYYANFFDSSLDVATYVDSHFARLADETFGFRESYLDSTLPYWFLQRIAMPLSTLATETCQRWANGRFWAWEGVGCCLGTCTHVWSYAQAVGRLFPELERSVRELQDLDETMNSQTGEVLARASMPPGVPDVHAMDGQAAVILKSYREHLMSADDNFLDRNWARIKLALSWLLAQEGGPDGLMEGKQPAYDTPLYGANTMIGSLFLAALRAGEEMARRMEDIGFADRLRLIFMHGQQATVERLWNGEYFIQDVDDQAHPTFQYGDGCLADQLIGQGWAHQLGLGYLYPREKVQTALESIWRYNWAPDVASQNEIHTPLRIFAESGEGGLLLCTWPKSRHPRDNAILYRNEVWSGIEYQVASHMLYEGMIEKGLAIVRTIHDRYDSAKHNPWNEIECGDHYARALAAWGCLLAVSGYSYDGPAGKIGFAPKLTPHDFKAFFSAADGWGNYRQTREANTQRSHLDLRWGRLELRSIILELPKDNLDPGLQVSLAGDNVAAICHIRGSSAAVEMVTPVVLRAPVSLGITLRW